MTPSPSPPFGEGAARLGPGTALSQAIPHERDIGELRRIGKRIEDNYAQVVHFRDGKVAESWTHQWDPNKVAELFS